MDASSRPRLLENLRTEPLERRVLVYDPNGGMVVELNATAGLVVQLCDGSRTVPEITAVLAEAFPQSAADVTDEVPTIVDQLVEGAVLEWS